MKVEHTSTASHGAGNMSGAVSTGKSLSNDVQDVLEIHTTSFFFFKRLMSASDEDAHDTDKK